jgi:hypothetical protein
MSTGVAPTSPAAPRVFIHTGAATAGSASAGIAAPAAPARAQAVPQRCGLSAAGMTGYHLRMLDSFLRGLVSVQSAQLQEAAQADDLPAMRQLLMDGADPRSVDPASVPPASADLLVAAEKINRLGIQPGNHLDEALRRYDLDAARQELAQFGAGKEALWSVAMVGGAGAIMRAMLALEPQADLEALAQAPVDAFVKQALKLPDDYAGGLLHAGHLAGLHGGQLAAFLASIPHLNTGHAHELNGLDEVWCRHWATAWLAESGASGSAQQLDYDAFKQTYGSTDKDQRAAVTQQYEALCAQASETYLASNANAGSMMSDLFAGMAPGETKRMLVLASHHAMAMELRHEANPGGPRYAVHFYDPNTTTLHTSAYADDLHVVSNWTLGSFLQAGAAAAYYRNQEEMTAFAVLPDSGFPAADVPRLQDRRFTRTYVDQPLSSPTAVFSCVLDRFDGELAGLPAHVAGLPADEAWDLMSFAPRGRSAGSMAVQRQDERVAGLFGQALRLSAIPIDRQVRLLEECAPKLLGSDNGVGHLRAFDAMVTAAALPDDAHAELFRRLSVKEAGGFYYALVYNHPDEIQALGEMLLRRPLPQDVLAQWLMAYSKLGQPTLNRAVCDGSVEAIRAFGKVIHAAQDQLSTADLFNVLLAEGSEANALYSALKEGKTEALRAYGEIVRDSVLPTKERRLLLCSFSGNTKTFGALVALVQGKHEALTAYGDMLAQCLPLDDAQTTLLTSLALGKQGGPSLSEVLAAARDDPTKDALIDLLYRFELLSAPSSTSA